MFPHERSLVERLKDEPFALVGVNSDGDYAEKKQKEFVEEKITWRSFAAGSTTGAIPKAWGVQGWPTLYLIDAEGKIRRKWVGSPGDEALDRAIDALVQETRAKAGGAAPPKKKAG
jgi:hypothetical protein